MYRGSQVDVYTKMQNLISEPKARTVELHPRAAPPPYTARLCTFRIHHIRFYTLSIAHAPFTIRFHSFVVSIIIRLVTTHPDCPDFVCAHSIIQIFLATLCFFDTKRLCTVPLLHIPIQHS